MCLVINDDTVHNHIASEKPGFESWLHFFPSLSSGQEL